MDKHSNLLSEQLEDHAPYLQDFINRFFDHIDPESRAVKSLASPVISELTFFSCRRSNCIQSFILEFYGSIRYVLKLP